MDLDFDESRIPKDVAAIWAALVRLVRSLLKKDVLVTGEVLVVGRNPIAHGRRGQGSPTFAGVAVRGTTPVATSVGDLTPTHVIVYAAAGCTVDVLVRF